MKRFIAAMLAGTMIFSLAACGSQPSDGGVETTGTKNRKYYKLRGNNSYSKACRTECNHHLRR